MEGVVTSSVETAMDIRPFHVAVPEGVLDDMRRIGATRWPYHELVDDRSQSYVGYGRGVGFASLGGVVSDERQVCSAPAWRPSCSLG
jgi:hypothetical protein